jgi:hypothetical protein
MRRVCLWQLIKACLHWRSLTHCCDSKMQETDKRSVIILVSLDGATISCTGKRTKENLDGGVLALAPGEAQQRVRLFQFEKVLQPKVFDITILGILIYYRQCKRSFIISLAVI